jgi:hypothetical protein
MVARIASKKTQSKATTTTTAMNKPKAAPKAAKPMGGAKPKAAKPKAKTSKGK